MEIVDRLIAGLGVGLEPMALLLITAGVVLGVLVGAAPGLGATVGMAIVLPLTFGFSTAEHAIFFLVSIFVGVNYGNAIPAVLVNIPGTPGALLTATEGHPFHQRGEGTKALLVALVGSVVGQLMGIVMFVFFVIPLANVAIQLLFPELFAIVVFGMLCTVGFISRDVGKGLVSLVIGLVLAAIGQDPLTSVPRLDLGMTELTLGLALIPTIVGLLAFREVFNLIEQAAARSKRDGSSERVRPERRLPSLRGVHIGELLLPIAVGAVVGVLIGAIPGAGSSVAMFVCYRMVRAAAREKSGRTGHSEGTLAGLEASNNGAPAGELIPTFALGIPGAAPMVIIMAALSARGVYAGPQLLQSQPDILYSLFGGLLVATVVLAVVGYLVIWPSVYVANLSRAATAAVTVALVVVGVYSLRESLFDVWVALILGVLAYIMDRFDYPVAPAALAFILGPMLERNLRTGLVMTDGPAQFVSRPITASLLVLALAVLIGPWYWSRRKARKERASQRPRAGADSAPSQ